MSVVKTEMVIEKHQRHGEIKNWFSIPLNIMISGKDIKNPYSWMSSRMWEPSKGREGRRTNRKNKESMQVNQLGWGNLHGSGWHKACWEASG